MLNIIKDNFGARPKYKRLGRGIGSGKGKTSARGGKGQTARTGVAINGFEGGQMPLYRRLPKRGFNSLNTEVVEVINFDSIETFIKAGKLKSNITINDLRNSGLLKGILSKVKLLGNGELKTKITIQAHAVSKSAEEALKKSGSTVEIVKFERQEKKSVHDKIVAKPKAEKVEKTEKKTVKAAPKKAEAAAEKTTKKVAAKKKAPKE
jgi:large subunit ribosomal protein L15